MCLLPKDSLVEPGHLRSAVPCWIPETSMPAGIAGTSDPPPAAVGARPRFSLGRSVLTPQAMHTDPAIHVCRLRAVRCVAHAKAPHGKHGHKPTSARQKKHWKR